MEIKGLILAAGRGKRMGNLTNDAPKGFFEINFKRLIDWQLDAFNASGIKNVAIVTGYKRELFNFNTHYFINEDWSNTNSVKSILCASNWFGEQTVIVSY